MPEKKKFNDMTPSSKRSIRNIPAKLDMSDPDPDPEPSPRSAARSKPAPASASTNLRRVAPAVVYSASVPKRAPARERESVSSVDRPDRPRESKPRSSGTSSGSGKRSYRRSWIIVTFAVLVVSLGLIAAALSLVFSKGTIVVKPKTVTVAVNTSQVATLNAVSPALGYQIVTSSDTASVDVPATLGAQVEKKATGTVILYNANPTAQKIILGTRLSNTKGLIYRTTYQVTIPAQTIVKGKAVPGSIAVGIVADIAGPGYNSTLTDLTGDFKVVAYQGSAKYTTIYARSKTDITGGYSGRLVTADKTATAAAEKNLEAQLATKLTATAQSLVPKGYVLYDDAHTINYVQLAVTPSATASTSATVSVKATYSGYVFKESDLVRSFAKDQLAQFPADGYELDGVESLVYTPKANSAAIAKSAAASTTISFSLKGSMKIIGTVPVDNLKKDLVGIKIGDSASVIKRYSTIGSAYAKIFPVWMRTLPDSTDRITIEVQND